MNPFYLKKFRQSTGLNQKEFAQSCELSVHTLKSYELGRRELSLDKFREIKSYFGYLYSHDSNRLKVMIDYLRVTFRAIQDLEEFCQRFLFVNLSEFTHHATALLNYNRVWQRGDIWLFDYADKHDSANYQVTLQLSGKGCRQLELIFEQQGKDWYQFLSCLVSFYDNQMHVTRIDLAVDELYMGREREAEHFLLSDMIAKYYRKELVFNSLRTWNYIGGGTLNFNDEADIEANRQGISLYFGSRQSSLFFNFYEKRFELAKQENITVSEALEIFGIWNRYELRFSDAKADGVIEEYLSGIDIGEIARAVVNDKMQVYDGVNAYGAYLADRKWQSMFGGVEPLKLSVSPEPYSIDRTINWLRYQVSPSLAMVSEYDKIVNEEYLRLILESGELNDRQKEILSNVRRQYATGKGLNKIS
ncbi:replication initiation factor domain-containing protein [Streptococcus sp. H49]|uniref:replication initiation factor domain-containing protein n=1 Tax=Streptococcus huangxiaojuni TaxID=3237239 RepID=UPI0034A1584B